MQEFAGCGAAVRAIRSGFLNLLPEQTDTRLTGRLVSLVKAINRRDVEGIRGKRAILFSTGKPLFLSLIFNVLQNMAEMIKNHFVCTHPITRAEATLKVTDLLIKKAYVPEGATYFRLQNHLSIISDYTYSELDRRYEPVSLLNAKSTFKYSEYTRVDTPHMADVLAAFPVGTELDDDCSVIQCVGIEFYIQAGANVYLPVKGSSSMMVVDAF